MKGSRVRNRFIFAVALFVLLAIPFLMGLSTTPTTPESALLSSNASFSGKALVMIPPPLQYDSSESHAATWIERLNYVGADGIMIELNGWWNHAERFKETLQLYRDAGFLIAGHWGHHCEYQEYCPRFNPPMEDWALTHQHQQMAIYWRIYINSSELVASAHEQGRFTHNLNVIQSQDGSLTVKLRDLDYYEPVYSKGVRFNVSSVYEEYAASEFSWLYEESKGIHNANETKIEKGMRVTYGSGYRLYIENNSLYATIYDPRNRDFNLYVLFYVPSFPSVYFLEGRRAWLVTLENFLANFSGYIDAHFQNSGGFPVRHGDFNPEIIESLETKYELSFSFDNWIHDDESPWDKKNTTQFVFDRENYFIFEDYAREKHEILQENGVIYVPTGSDMRHMTWAMIEHVDALLVNSFLDSYKIVRYGWSWASKEWPPSTIRLGIWNSYILHEDSSGDDIREWGFYTIDEALKWNPIGATMTFWTATTRYALSNEQWEALKQVTDYIHDRFKHVIMLPSEVNRHTVATIYQLSHAERYRVTTEINPGQIDIYPLYIKDLKWDSLPNNACLLYYGDGGGAVNYVSQINDTQAHSKITQAVWNGSTIAFSGNALRRIETYYEGTDIPTSMNDMFQTERWTHMQKPGYASHYLTFNGTFDPRYLNGSEPGGYWIKLKSNASADIIAGEHPYAGLYETEFGEGNIIGFSKTSNPFETFFTDASSATYGDEYSVRFFEYCAGKVGSFRLWDVGKTFVYQLDESTYYALLVERYGIPRYVPVEAFGMKSVRIVDLDTHEEIQNGSKVFLDADSTKLLLITLESGV